MLEADRLIMRSAKVRIESFGTASVIVALRKRQRIDEADLVSDRPAANLYGALSDVRAGEISCSDRRPDAEG